MRRSWIVVSTFLLAAAVGTPAAAELPDAATFLGDIGLSPDQVAQVEAGSMVTLTIQPSTERELVTAFAFLVKAAPKALVSEMKTGAIDRMDPNTIAFAMIEGPPTLASFAKLTLDPGGSKRAQAYVNARPGGDLNLSAAEIASFGALGSEPSLAAVEQAVRSALLARLEAYRARGLAGIEPYARADGKPRSPADELRSATVATKKLHALVPAAHEALLAYPSSKPPGTEEAYRWSHYSAHGVPTLALTHSLYVPDGDAFVVAQRQFYVSGGYNCEQGLAALLPMQTGTLVVYTNRTSTDQVTGFGGGAKRSIGSKLLASQLEALYEKIRAGER
jgi:hypothetical protein